MKKMIVLAVFLCAAMAIKAQSVELTPLFGYSVAGKVDNYGRYFDIKDDLLYGGLLSVEIDDKIYVELSYQRNDTRVLAKPWDAARLREYDLAVEHYQVGSMREFGEGKLVPFARISLGTSRYAQKSEGDNTAWLFSAGFGGGAKFMFSESVGVRLFTNLMMPMEFNGAGIFCGIGGGCSGNISFNVPIMHWDMGFGLLIKLPERRVTYL